LFAGPSWSGFVADTILTVALLYAARLPISRPTPFLNGNGRPALLSSEHDTGAGLAGLQNKDFRERGCGHGK